MPPLDRFNQHILDDLTVEVVVSPDLPPRTEMRCRRCNGHSSAQTCWPCTQVIAAEPYLAPKRCTLRVGETYNRTYDNWKKQWDEWASTDEFQDVWYNVLFRPKPPSPEYVAATLSQIATWDMQDQEDQIFFAACDAAIAKMDPTAPVAPLPVPLTRYDRI